ncbi:Gfo/Idh/MocA family protein [Microbacterium sp. NPDC089698]|uniref:Gfo/Idh/MocA family protein n=1 Tax=Microbacterium sp. NPDC089698 TaxID=3364200 RepID=UPI00382C47A0
MALPAPRPIDPHAVPALRWGVIGTGWIAGRFTDALHRHTAQRVTVVAARDAERTAAFAAAHGIETAVTDRRALLDAVDAAYIAVPHSAHAALAREAIAARRHVLVEKPFATGAAEAREVIDAARAAGVLAMEAMWTRYLPQSEVLRRLISDGDLGEIHHVAADFGSVAPYDPAGRMWNPSLGGGALLDLGVYPISFASSILGAPDRIQASGSITPDGIDLRATALLGYAHGADAVASTSMVSRTAERAEVIGSAARVDVLPSFFAPTGLRVTRRVGRRNEVEEWIDDTFTERYDGLGYQATALAQYVGDGRTESPLHPLDEVASVLDVIDRIRAQLTVVDPARFREV